MTSFEPGVLVEQRVLPFPRSISVQAREYMYKLVNDEGVPLNSTHSLPSAGDQAGWIALQAVVAERYSGIFQRRASSLQSTVETVVIGETVVHVAEPAGAKTTDAVMLEIHGGAFVFGGGEACRIGTRMQADRHRLACYGVDYKMPPVHPYPAALEDCMTVYRHLLSLYGPKRVVISGRSAGGNLAAAMLLRAKAEGLPQPGALVLLSPEVDLTESGDSFETNRMIDVVLPAPLMPINLLYADGADLANPYLSPLFGDLRDLPPTLLQSGTRDLFLSNTVRMHRALRAAGVQADLHVFEGMPHGGFTGGAPEDAELSMEIAGFIARHLNATHDARSGFL